jgi:hypothetical protein
VNGWSVTAITAGVWLSAGRADPPADVRALRAGGRPSLVVDADGPDERTDELIEGLFPLLSAHQVPVRLVLSEGAERYVAPAAASGLDLIAAEGTVAIMPAGHAVVRPVRGGSESSPPQWRRFRPSGATEAVGAIAPSPAWERGLATATAAAANHGLAVRRVPAGLALRLTGPRGRDATEALAAWPDPERITIVRDGAGRDAHGQDGMLARGLATLLPLLPLSESDGVRVYWPRAGMGAAAADLGELASSVGADLIAPAGDVSVIGYSALCHGPMGTAPWLRFTSSGEIEVLGSLHPAPAWKRELDSADLDTLLDEGSVEHIAAGLYLPPSPGNPGLTATACSIIPDPAALTVVSGCDAYDRVARQGVESLVQRLPAAARDRLRLLLAGAGAGGPDSFAQLLASAFGCQVVAPVGRWTATPDGRVRALPDAGSGSRVPGQTWAEFWPAAGHGKSPRATFTSEPAG